MEKSLARQTQGEEEQQMQLIKALLLHKKVQMLELNRKEAGELRIFNKNFRKFQETSLRSYIFQDLFHFLNLEIS